MQANTVSATHESAGPPLLRLFVAMSAVLNLKDHHKCVRAEKAQVFPIFSLLSTKGELQWFSMGDQNNTILHRKE